MNFRFPSLLGALAVLLLAGCSSLPFGGPESGPVYTPKNVRGPAQWPTEILRVAVLPAYDATGHLTPEFTATYDRSWARALDRTQRAEFVVIDRHALADWTGRETISSTEALPADLLGHIAQATGAQAVVFLDLTHCAAYPPLGLGFRAKLVTLPSAAIVWAADELFDTADAATARAAERFANSNDRGPGDPASAVLQSPSRFAAFAFQAVADLLPPHVVPLPAPTH